MELDSYSVSLATVVRALLLNDWKGKSAALPGHCPGGPVSAAAYAWTNAETKNTHDYDEAQCILAGRNHSSGGNFRGWVMNNNDGTLL